MSNPVEVKVSGLKELQDALEGLSVKKAPAAVRSGLKAGANVIYDAIVRETPKDSGLLADSIDIKTRVRGAALTGSAFVGPNAKVTYPAAPGRFGKKARAIPAWVVARFHELGTSRMAANPFMTRAFEANKQKATDAVIAKLKEILNK